MLICINYINCIVYFARKIYHFSLKFIASHRFISSNTYNIGMFQNYEVKCPEKRKAISTVQIAIKDGRLLPVHTYTCTRCYQVPAKHYHHYLGYAPKHWLDVIPVCIKCHKKQHRLIKTHQWYQLY